MKRKKFFNHNVMLLLILSFLFSFRFNNYFILNASPNTPDEASFDAKKTSTKQANAPSGEKQPCSTPQINKGTADVKADNDSNSVSAQVELEKVRSEVIDGKIVKYARISLSSASSVKGTSINTVFNFFKNIQGVVKNWWKKGSDTLTTDNSIINNLANISSRIVNAGKKSVISTYNDNLNYVKFACQDINNSAKNTSLFGVYGDITKMTIGMGMYIKENAFTFALNKAKAPFGFYGDIVREMGQSIPVLKKLRDDIKSPDPIIRARAKYTIGKEFVRQAIYLATPGIIGRFAIPLKTSRLRLPGAVGANADEIAFSLAKQVNKPIVSASKIKPGKNITDLVEIDGVYQIPTKSIVSKTTIPIKVNKANRLNEILNCSTVDDVITKINSMNNISDWGKTRLLLAYLNKYHPISGQHSITVGMMSQPIGKVMEYSLSALRSLFIKSLLHDIGKVYISKYLLNKKNLTPDEKAIINTHAEKGAELLRKVGLGKYADGADGHHKRPDEKTGVYGSYGGCTEPSMDAKIISSVDAPQAMAQERGFNKIKTLEEIEKILKENKGTQFYDMPADAALSTIQDWINSPSTYKKFVVFNYNQLKKGIIIEDPIPEKIPGVYFGHLMNSEKIPFIRNAKEVKKIPMGVKDSDLYLKKDGFIKTSHEDMLNNLNKNNLNISEKDMVLGFFNPLSPDKKTYHGIKNTDIYYKYNFHAFRGNAKFGSLPIENIYKDIDDTVKNGGKIIVSLVDIKNLSHCFNPLCEEYKSYTSQEIRYVLGGDNPEIFNNTILYEPVLKPVLNANGENIYKYGKKYMELVGFEIWLPKTIIENDVMDQMWMEPPFKLYPELYSDDSLN